ncbi:hypothetical protein C7999DRAFT_39776 [Corynascus novoguineensis]|uniref:Essential protein Yae1 N-terminal domain-containing protein n=1 Tax=Corynascus novoguineensis TaxID=1126955 RepID=A0AAN7HS47_9PEZI|nr:hypothetical protein C7999DRAFT_39776 [Corynascus novoguineensis]
MATTSAQPPPAPSSTTSTSTQTPMRPPGSDPFDALLTLEDQFYTEGYDQGTADGLVAGRTEGRQLGLERGFQKFVEAGRLQGRAIVWANRLRLGQGHGQGLGQGISPPPSVSLEGGKKAQRVKDGFASSALGTREGEEEVGKGDNGSSSAGGHEDAKEEAISAATATLFLPPLPDNPRLSKHVITLYALAETESLSTENTDEAVDDFDDRLRRAQGRFKVIERMTGEGDGGKSKGPDGNGHDPGSKGGKGEGTADV